MGSEKGEKGSISDKYQVTITHDFEMLESKFIQYDDFNSDELKKITVQEAAEKGIEGKLTLEELYCKGLIGMPLKEYLYVETNDEEERVFGGVYLIYDCRELYKKGFVTQVNEVRAQHRSELFYMNLNVSNEIINFADNYV